MWKNMVRVITVVRVLIPCATVTTAMSVVSTMMSVYVTIVWSVAIT